MALTLAARSSASLGAGATLRRRSAGAGPASRPAAVRPVAARAYSCGSRSYYGPGNEDARRAMQEMLREMGRSGAGFAWPGGSFWFGADLGGVGSACDEDSPATGGQQQRPAYRLAIDLAREPDAYTVTADVPGITKDDLSIRLVQRTPKQPAALVVSGARPAAAAAAAAAGAEPMLRERQCGAFERRVPLPDDAGVTGITARVRDGVLTVRVPRVEKPKEQGDTDIPIL